MTVTIDLEPAEEARLQQEALRYGKDAQGLLKGLLQEQVSYLLSRPTEPPAWVAGR
jgi:hypothetical protein